MIGSVTSSVSHPVQQAQPQPPPRRPDNDGDYDNGASDTRTQVAQRPSAGSVNILA